MSESIVTSDTKELPLTVEKSSAPEFDARFVLSAASPDRVNDTIAPAAYKSLLGKRYTACWDHKHDKVIGYWDNLKAIGDRLVGDLKCIPTSVGQMAKLCLAEGVPLCASIGFIGKGERNDKGGVHFTQLELGEVSLVIFPAHERAVQIAKSFGITLPDPAGQVPVSGGPAPQSLAASAARSHSRSKSMGKTISELVVETQNAQVAARDRLAEQTSKLGDIESPTSDEFITQKALVDQIDAELQAIDGKLATFKSAETRLAAGALATKSAQVLRRDSVKDTENLLGKLALVVYESRVKGMSMEQVAHERFPNSDAVETLVKAAQNPATTFTPGYAQELTRIGYGQLQEQLRAEALLPRITPAANNYTFDGSASIYVPTRLGTLTDASGAFRKEGDPIPVKGLTFGSKSLTPKSLGVILTATEEMLRRSVIDLASYFQTAMVQDTAYALDVLFLSNTAGSAIAPAGIRNGLVAGDTRASTGASASQITTDLKVMLSAMASQNMGSASLRWIMHPKNWFAVSMLLTATGAKQFPETSANQLAGIPVVTSTTMDPTIVLLVDFNQLAFAMGNPSFVASNVATLHEENTTPLPIASAGTPNTVAAPVRSLYQTNSWALRMIMDVDWMKLRTPGPVQELTAVAW
jgi:HK97 family phage major capsid protein